MPSHLTMSIVDDEIEYQGTYMQLRNADGSVVAERTAASIEAVDVVHEDDPPPDEEPTGIIRITADDEAEYEGTFVQLRSAGGDVVSEFPFARLAEDGIVLVEGGIEITAVDENVYRGTFIQLRDTVGNVISEFPRERIASVAVIPD